MFEIYSIGQLSGWSGWSAKKNKTKQTYTYEISQGGIEAYNWLAYRISAKSEQRLSIMKKILAGRAGLHCRIPKKNCGYTAY